MKTAQNLYSDIEGLRIGIEIEKRGIKFYQYAMEHSTVGEHKELFCFLAAEEDQHVDTFNKILTKLLTKYGEGTEDYLFDEDTSRYLTIIADMHVFPRESETKKVIDGLNDTLSILKLALQAEKDSILFYDELAINAKYSDSREVFIKLKKEEQAHVMIIKRKMQELGLIN